MKITRYSLNNLVFENRAFTWKDFRIFKRKSSGFILWKIAEFVSELLCVVRSTRSVIYWIIQCQFIAVIMWTCLFGFFLIWFLTRIQKKSLKFQSTQCGCTLFQSSIRVSSKVLIFKKLYFPACLARQPGVTMVFFEMCSAVPNYLTMIGILPYWKWHVH